MRGIVGILGRGDTWIGLERSRPPKARDDPSSEPEGKDVFFAGRPRRAGTPSPSIVDVSVGAQPMSERNGALVG